MKIKSLAVVCGAMMALAGCTLTKPDLRKDGWVGRLARDASGKLIMPKRVALRFVILSQPLGAESVDKAPWLTADAQVAGESARRALADNGLKLGIITGELPREVQALLDAEPPNRVDPTVVVIPSGHNTLVDLSHEPVEQVDLILNRDGKAVGKVYQQARGFLRLTAAHEGDSAVRLRLVPELHHGPIRRGWTAASTGPFEAQQLVMHDGQAEETFRELAAEIELRPGQVAVVGTVAEKKSSLGSFLLSKPEVNSDRLTQKLLLVWASRSDAGDAANVPAGGEAPKSTPDSVGLPTPQPPEDLEPVDPPDMPHDKP